VDRDVIETIVLGAAAAARGGRLGDYRRLIDRLASGPPGEAATVDTVVAARIEQAVTEAWRRGWQPADLPRVVGHRLSARHARLATDAVAAESRRYPPASLSNSWRSQLEATGARCWWREGRSRLAQWSQREGLERAEALACAIEVLAVLLHLPTVPKLGPGPGEAGAGPAARGPTPTSAHPPEGLDRRILNRVRALLAKAESTTFPDEAEALTAKAQELMARHAIDHAMLHHAAGGPQPPGGRRIGVDDPYAGPKALLLSGIATANRCRSVWSSGFGFSTVFGYEPDLETVEVLYTSLLVQATSAMVARGRAEGRRSRTRSFRQSFLVAFATRIASRLREAAAATVAEAAADHGERLLPVLAAREAAVDEAVQAVYGPAVRSASFSAADAGGWYAGLAAAEVASLEVRPAVNG
jgi:hypothetical protein